MPSDKKRPPAYWAMRGEAPCGPYTLWDIQSRVESGQWPSDTPVCRVGGEDWRPISEVWAGSARTRPLANPLFEPQAMEIEGIPAGRREKVARPARAVSSRAAPPTAQEPAPHSADPGDHEARKRLARRVLIAASCAAAFWLIYEASRPLTASETALRFIKSDSGDEASRYTTPNLHSALRAMDRTMAANDDLDDYEILGEEPPPYPNPGVLVWVRSRSVDRKSGRTDYLEWALHLIRTSGWKVDDALIVSQNGQSFATPLSVAAYYQSLDQGLPPAGYVDPTGTARRRGYNSDARIAEHAVRGVNSAAGNPAGKAMAGVGKGFGFLGALAIGAGVMLFQWLGSLFQGKPREGVK